VGEERNQNEMEGALLFDDEDDGGGERASTGGHAGDGKAEEALEFLAGVLSRMGLDARVTVREDGERVVLDVSGEDAGRVIGKKGMTLDALQFLANKVVNRFPDRRRYVVVDSGDYRERHDQGLVSMAKREAKRASTRVASSRWSPCLRVIDAWSTCRWRSSQASPRSRMARAWDVAFRSSRRARQAAVAAESAADAIVVADVAEEPTAAMLALLATAHLTEIATDSSGPTTYPKRWRFPLQDAKIGCIYEENHSNCAQPRALQSRD